MSAATGDADVRRGGRVRRLAVHREQHAQCPVCAIDWAGNDALASGSLHAQNTGHMVAGTYRADYVYAPANARYAP